MKFKIEGRHWKGEKTFPSLNDYIHELGRNPKAGARIKSKFEGIACDAVRMGLKGYKAAGLELCTMCFTNQRKGREGIT